MNLGGDQGGGVITGSDRPTIPIECPGCGVVNDGALDPSNSDAWPSEGSLSLCWNCGHLSIFTGSGTSLSVRPPTEEEKQEYDAIPEVIAYREIIARRAEARKQAEG